LTLLNPLTPAEITAGLTVNYAFAAGNVLRYGADPKGLADSTAAILTAQSVNKTVFFPAPGTYRVSSNLAFTPGVTYRLDDGALLSLDSGVTLSPFGQIDAGSYQIFSGAGTFNAPPYFSSTGEFNIKWWGAKGDGTTDDTAAINTALKTISQGTLYFPTGAYIVQAVNGAGGLVVPVAGGQPSLRGEGQYSLIAGKGFASSNPILTYASDGSHPAKSNFFVRDIAFSSDNSAAAAMSVSYVNCAEFTNICLTNLAAGIVTGTNVFSNLWTLWHIGGVTGRMFLVTQPGFNNNVFLSGRFGGQGFAMIHALSANGGNAFKGVDFEGFGSTSSTGGIYIAPTASGVMSGISFEGCYSENGATDLFYFNSPSAGAISGISIIGCYLNGTAGGANNCVTLQNCAGIHIRGNQFDSWANYVIRDLGGNTEWDIGPQKATNIGTGFTNATIQTISNGTTISTSTPMPNNQVTVNPSGGAATGVILAVGTFDGQTVTIPNVNGANSITMAAAATSHVATGTSCVIAAGTQKTFTWRATGLGTPAWFST
jgi:hypothetical protein